MSVTESFLSAGKQFLLATENLRRLDERVNRLTDDINGINMRLVRVETILAIENQQSQTRRKHKMRTLPGETS